LEVASTNEQLREATADVFESWIAGATEHFAAACIPRDSARELAFSMLSLLEGAFVFCRACAPPSLWKSLERVPSLPSKLLSPHCPARERFVRECGLPGEVVVMCEHLNITGFHKIRAVQAMFAAAERRGDLVPGSGQSVILATGGNLGKGAALLAAIRGYHWCFVIPDDYSECKIEFLSTRRLQSYLGLVAVEFDGELEGFVDAAAYLGAGSVRGLKRGLAGHRGRRGRRRLHPDDAHVLTSLEGELVRTLGVGRWGEAGKPAGLWRWWVCVVSGWALACFVSDFFLFWDAKSGCLERFSGW
jgi:hypothetical protein